MVDLNLNGLDVNDAFEAGKTSNLLDTGLYQGVVKYVYFTKTNAGGDIANAVIEINGLTHTFPMYITYKETKKPTRVKQGKVEVIPGYKQLNSLAYCACGKAVAQCAQEQKSILLRDWKSNKDVPTLVETISDLQGKPIIVGIKKLNKHKQAKVNGQYVPTTETYLTNEVDRYFTTDGYLASEKASGNQPTYALSWKEKTGTVFEEKLKVTPIAPPTTDLNSVASSNNAPVKDLFADE